jgi:hypothetical protein
LLESDLPIHRPLLPRLLLSVRTTQRCP